MTFLSKDLKPAFYGLIAPAASGKSSWCSTLQSRGFDIIHVDDFFIGDSLYRKDLLEYKQGINFEEFQDACNQFNWWNWDKLFKALSYVPEKPTFVEGAILGPRFILNKLEKIYYFEVDRQERFQRILKRDGVKRSFNEILARFLITEYSENLYYKNTFKKDGIRSKIIYINKYQEKDKNYFLPLGVVV